MSSHGWTRCSRSAFLRWREDLKKLSWIGSVVLAEYVHLFGRSIERQHSQQQQAGGTASMADDHERRRPLQGMYDQSAMEGVKCTRCVCCKSMASAFEASRGCHGRWGFNWDMSRKPRAIRLFDFILLPNISRLDHGVPSRRASIFSRLLRLLWSEPVPQPRVTGIITTNRAYTIGGSVRAEQVTLSSLWTCGRVGRVGTT